MNLAKIAIGLLLVHSTLFGQTIAGAPSQGSQAELQIIDFLKKTVVFVTVDYEDRGKPYRAQGTGFIVGYEDARLGPDRGFTYLVTNKHVADPSVALQRPIVVKKLTIRLNKAGGNSGVVSRVQEIEIPTAAPFKWYFSSDPAIDLAVTPISIDQKKNDVEAFPVSLFATKDVVEKERISEGDSILFAGLFYQFSGVMKVQPIIRQGIIAMIPGEPLTTTLGHPGHLYLADLHAFSGNSGSPVFINLGGYRNQRLTFGASYRLLGVVSGYVIETEKLELKVTTSVSGVGKANSGVATVVPADDLKELLDSDDLRKLRNQNWITARQKR